MIVPPKFCQQIRPTSDAEACILPFVFVDWRFADDPSAAVTDQDAINAIPRMALLSLLI